MSNLATITNNILADSGIDDLNVIVSTGSYNNPAWITALAFSKITGVPSFQLTSEKGQPNGYASLDSNGKVPLVQINDALIGNVNFQGLWNATTNTPTLANPPAAGTKGYYYIVSTAGTFAGITFEIGDWIISNGSAWGKVDNTDAVSSVFGRTGNVVAANGDYTTAQVTESGNLYYTDARSRAALSFSAGSGAYNTSTGVITIPTDNNQIANSAGYITSAALSGYVPTSRTITINGVTQDLSANRTFNVGTVTSVGLSSSTSGVTIGSTPVTSSGTITLAIATATATQNGLLSSTDWTTFNNKAPSVAGGYLPLSGGTLTGPLNGTSLAFNSFGRFGGSTIGTNFAVNMGANTSIYFNEIDSATAELSAVNNANTSVKILRLQAPGGATQIGGTLAVTGDATFTTTITAGVLSRIGNVFIAGRTGTYVTYSDGIFGDNLHLGATGTGGAVYINTALNRNFIVNPVGGNVGIGTTSVSGTYEKLAVAGGISIKDNTNAKLEIGRYNTTGAQNSYIKLGANSNSLRFTNNTDIADIMELTNSGNLGLGVTPNAWGSNYKVLQIGNAAFWSETSGGTGTFVSQNAFFDGASWRYISNGFANSYIQTNIGSNIWQTAPSGTAGNAISFTQAMTLNASGNLLVGTTTDNGARLQVNGTATVSSSFTAGNIFNVSTSTNYTTFTGNAGGNQFSHSLGLAVAWNYTSGGGEVAFGSNKGAGGVGGFKFYDWDGTTSTLLVTILPSGAATFSSSVTANGNSSTNSAIIANNNGAGGTAQHYQDFGNGAGFVAGRILRGNGASGFAANGLNILSYDSFQISANATGGSGGSINLMGGNVLIGTTTNLGYRTDSRDSLIVSNTDPTTNFTSSTGASYIRGSVLYNSVLYPSIWRQQLENIGFFNGVSDLTWALSANGGAYSTEMKLNLNGLYIKASNVGNEASNVPIFISDPASTIQQIYAKPLQNFKIDVGSFIAKGVRTNSGDYTRTLDSVNDYSLWQNNFTWLSSYSTDANNTRVIIEAQTTGRIQSDNTADKQLTIGWGISTDADFNSESYSGVNVPLGTGAADFNVIITGTITITSTAELKMVIQVQIANGNIITQNVMRMANVTAAGAMLNANKNIAFTGKMDVTGTHTWSQRQTYLRLN